MQYAGNGRSMIEQLNERSREIFRHIVDAYVETGEPVGSRTLSRRLGMSLSPATIRNVMADLEEAGLLFAPHTSAGRLPTDAGLRLFVDGLLEIGGLSRAEQESIEGRCQAVGRSLSDVLEDATATLSGLSRCAGLVVSPKSEEALKHIEFVNIGGGRALVVMVTMSGMVENRVIGVPAGLPPSAMVEAANYLNSRLVGRTLQEVETDVRQEIEEHRTELDQLSSSIVEAGMATWSGLSDDRSLIIKGQANLLENVRALDDLERIRALFETLETKDSMLRLMQSTDAAEGVQIFIGAENALFGLTGCSMVVAPYANSREQIVGAIGVIGPTRLNYARIIPLVDYTAKVVSRLIG